MMPRFRPLKTFSSFPKIEGSRVTYTSILSCFEETLLRCLQVAEIYHGLPFVANLDKRQLQEIPKRKFKQYQYRFHYTVLYFLLTVAQTALAWKQMDFGYHAFIGTYNIGILLTVCCSIANYKYPTLICQLNNEMHCLIRDENHNVKIRSPKSAIQSAKIYHHLMITMLAILPCVIYIFLILYLPCLPSFIGNILLSECTHMYPQTTPISFSSPVLVKILISFAWFLPFTMCLGNIAVHYCFSLYHGYTFPLYVVVFFV